MTIKDFYAALNADFAGVMSRLMKEQRVAKFVMLFPQDPSHQTLLDSFAAGDIDTAFRAAHTMKGLSANLGFTKLYEKTVIVTEELRGGNPGPSTPDEIKDLTAEYTKTVDAIAEYAANKTDF